jgi:2-polyprenyl-3-methyl-5-hydroxy-6-metoxy-1,4-benzoquinol methylase
MYQPPTDATRQHWDNLALEYDDLKQRNDAYYGALKQCFDRAVPAECRASVLDVGCGTGQVLASLSPGRGVGIDLSEQMIDKAREQFALRKELAFLAIDARAAGELGPFDAVISADTMEHVEDWPMVVEAIVHACRPGGLIVISTPNPAWAFPLWVLEKLRLKMPEGPHRFVAISKIAQCMQEFGCQIVSRTTHLLVPARVGGIGPAVSSAAERMPVLRSCGVIQLVVARRGLR